MKTISPENDSSFTVNPEFRDNLESGMSVNISSATDVFLGISQKYSEHLF